MSLPELAGFSEVLDQENPDLYKWLTGQQQPPPDMARTLPQPPLPPTCSAACGVQVANPAFASLLSHVTHFLEAKSRVATRAKLGAEWVRGWGDSGEPGADAAAARRLPSSGNQQ